MSLYKKRLKLVRGKGVYVWDENENRYLDAIAGIGVAILGHSNEELAIAINEQMKKLIVAGPMFHHEEKDEALEELSKFVSFEYAYFGNSGTEAVEAALKFARLYTGRKEIIAMTNAFHGRTFGSLSATWKKKYKEGFEPLVPGFKHISFNNIEVAKEAITKETAAVIVEPIQGEGGIIPAKEEFIKTLRDLTQDKGALLIVDEVQSAFRTGKFLAIEHYKVQPDIITMGKGLANGTPIGLTLTNFDIPRGKHGSTFGGNPLACKAMATTLKILRREKLIEKTKEKGISIEGDKVIMTRGKGLMLGVLLKENAGKYVETLQERGLLVNTAGNRVIRLLPPLIITKEQMLWIKETIEGVLNG
ncbi:MULTISPECIES: acetylornithine/succinylornithine family transaminase [Thermococcus]|nr:MULTISPECIES: acetylornithine/succinylornithine family transaminase [Thermococcus]MBC7094640.1 acetylornithine/succinylornithine family transaminase [Thermococcus sp.]HII67882.1 acetylornithine/succinylornithine family transaminase [Thermococcaceae archaeon]